MDRIYIRCAGLSQLSIKTRIETKGLNSSNRNALVWVSYPLKQGLKPSFYDFTMRWRGVWVSYPLKQGLKQNHSLRDSWLRLSLSQLSIKTRIETVSLLYATDKTPCLSQLSIKTRIETHHVIEIINPHWEFESAIH